MVRQQNLYLLLFSLYWAQGLPVGFMTHALPVILRAEGVSLAHIGGFGLLMLPWSIKIFWAPWVDRHALSRLGHYRSWILPTQFLTVGVLCILSFFPVQALDQPIYLFAFFISLLFMNLTGATQDIATDALAVNLLKHDQQHWGNTFQVIGSRLGFIVGGGAVLWCLDWLTWQPTFLLLATLVFLNTLPIWLFKEPQHTFRSKRELKLNQLNLTTKIKAYLSYFSQNKELRSWLVVLITFKVADGLAGPLLKPLMVDMGLSFTRIGVYITMLGAVAALAGAAMAGGVLKYFSRPTALIVFSVFKIMSLGAYAYLAYAYEQKNQLNVWVIYTVNALEDAFSAMLLVVMLTLVMYYSRKEYAGTDFTFQVSVMATVSGLLYSFSGVIGDVLGYFHYLIAIVIIGVLSLLPIYFWKHAKLQEK
ncbi:MULTISPECIES: MFS transporter [unclassified Acinetobacter]|uniref:MFS transporter n=1 Tax=unclassified Acinetobacter TaxID=196816 RepID=UPI00287E98AB|nr:MULTISPECIES: MFS transporter [unclassified Acinetobacter]MDS7956282.1 MFS transporter [Acinetobacter sp. V104_13]MDS7984219.1 MFS transporter [Acinetobacter sp. V104_3]